jgi:soluble lytic murein transglycosylase-like protein
VESGSKAHVVAGNLNGSHDIGLMQINSWWLPKLQRYGITEQQLLADPCLNLNVGAWILSGTLRDHGFNWRGLGAYNAKTDSLRAVYAAKVVRELRKVHAMGYSDALTYSAEAAAR